MPITIAADDTIYINDLTITGAPAVRITGARVRFVNSESGRVVTTTSGQPAIRIEGEGTVIVNEAGGVIRSDVMGDFEPLIIVGSGFADRVENAGVIRGRVALGEGADIFVSRVLTNDFATRIELGGGDDFFYLRPASIVSLGPAVDGGDGIDRFIMFESDGNIGGGLVSNVEILELRANGIVESFSGLDQIVVDFSDSDRNATVLRFFNSPDADVTIIAGDGISNLSIYDRSRIGTLTGSDQMDGVNIGSDTLVSGEIALGAGDDSLTVFRSQFEAVLQSVLGTEIDGGEGTDSLFIQLRGGDLFDAGNLVNFERVRISAHDPGSGGPLVVRGLAGVGEVIISQQSAPVVLELAALPVVLLFAEPRVNLTIGAGSVIGAIRSFQPFPLDTPVADDTQSLTIRNDGQILGDVRLYIGDDLFDSRLGTVGGRVYGYAGNDTIMTGQSDDWLEGGAGGDRLAGGAGADRLDGGSAGDMLEGGEGDDQLIGGAGSDSLTGGLGNDWYFVDGGDTVIEGASEGTLDRVFAGTSFVLTAGAHIEILSTDFHAGTAAINLSGNELDNFIYGNAGNNVLDGKGGIDTLVGFGGDDWHFVDHASDYVVEGASEGTGDRIFASVSYTLAPGSHVEIFSTDFHAGTAAINLSGNELGNLIFGNAGNNVLDGRQGSDTLVGFGGDDFYFVDNAGDSIVEGASEGTGDRVFASTSYTLSAGAHIEIMSTDFHAGTAAIDLSGNELGNSIYGNAGNNVLDGKQGNDALVGFGGVDTFAFTTALGATNVDILADFDADDVIALDDAVFAGLSLGSLSAGAFAAGPAATTAGQRIVYNQATGELFYDADGNGAGAQMLFASLQGAPLLTASDFTVI